MKKSQHLILSLALTTLIFPSCEKNDPVIPNEEEVITTLHYRLTPVGKGETVTLSFQDLDGDGGQAPVNIGGTLQANTHYTGRLELLNEIESPNGVITDEIREEDEDHQFFFETTITDLVVSYTTDDVDENNKPVGIDTQIITGEAAEGSLKIILRHQPDKSAAGVSDGEIELAGGETDIEINFVINVI